MGKTAWVSGATGVIGQHLIHLLSQNANYDKIIAFVRKPVINEWQKNTKIEQLVIDYTQLEMLQFNTSVDDLFCALGSTTQKTPDKKAYYQVDVQYPLNFAQLGIQNGAKFYGLVSSHGASPKALSYYFKMKGELEISLKDYAFEHIAIARPSLLKDKRKEYRLLEHLSGFAMSQLPGNYKSISAIKVATALIQAANNKKEGVEILQSKFMQSALTT